MPKIIWLSTILGLIIPLPMVAATLKGNNKSANKLKKAANATA
jgi:hypothetical protein